MGNLKNLLNPIKLEGINEIKSISIKRGNLI